MSDVNKVKILFVMNFWQNMVYFENRMFTLIFMTIVFYRGEEFDFNQPYI